MEAKCDRKMHNFILRQVEREFGHTIPKVHILFEKSLRYTLGQDSNFCPLHNRT